MQDKLKIVFNKEEVEEKIAELAEVISRDYQDKDLVLLCVLKGAFVFAGDLMKKLSIPSKIEFIRISSYGDSKKSSGVLKIKGKLEIDLDIRGKDILIVEDIIDSGLTMEFLVDYLKNYKPNKRGQSFEKKKSSNHEECYAPNSVKICSLINRLNVENKKIEPDYVCFNIDSKDFFVGCGMDFSERYRNLPYIAAII